VFGVKNGPKTDSHDSIEVRNMATGGEIFFIHTFGFSQSMKAIKKPKDPTGSDSIKHFQGVR
jgi:hypothetical protein